MNKSGETILRLRNENYMLIKSLASLLEWAKGNRGTREGNPYGKPEVKDGLKTLAHITGDSDYLDVDTEKLGE